MANSLKKELAQTDAVSEKRLPFSNLHYILCRVGHGF